MKTHMIIFLMNNILLCYVVLRLGALLDISGKLGLVEEMSKARCGRNCLSCKQLLHPIASKSTKW